jgi:hypothetical protein
MSVGIDYASESERISRRNQNTLKSVRPESVACETAKHNLLNRNGLVVAMSTRTFNRHDWSYVCCSAMVRVTQNVTLLTLWATFSVSFGELRAVIRFLLLVGTQFIN